MDSEKILSLFDRCWFETKILEKQKQSSTSLPEPNSDHQIQEKSELKPEFLRLPTTHRRSMSAQISSDLLTGFSSFPLSPDSVLSPPKLQTIMSGKQVTQQAEEEYEETQLGDVLHHEEEEEEENRVFKKASRRRRRKKNSESKSLSDLEFEELKGFMDLGFVFTEEDNKDSRLVEIVPALQRLQGRNKLDDTTINTPITTTTSHHPCAVSRPYLSEAWEIMDARRTSNSSLLLNLKIPALDNETDVKDKLRWWAHSVALSAVR